MHATAHGTVNCPSDKRLSASSGLICCTDWSGSGIRIGNPITRDFDLYPLPEKIRASSFLGFDPVDKRHVMLKIERKFGCFGSPAKINVVSLPEREVHEISPYCISDGHWISYGDDFYTNYGGEDCSICINGVIYFIAWANFPRSGVRNSRLYGFDIRLECIEMIQHPLYLEGMFSVLTENKGRVALVIGDWRSIYYEFPPSDDYNMDGMKFWVIEDPKKQSWSVKSFVVPWGRSKWNISTKFSGVTPRGDLIFATALSEGGSIEMFLYNIDTNTLRRFEIDGFGPIPRDYRLARFNFLIESLHSPKRRQLFSA